MVQLILLRSFLLLLLLPLLLITINVSANETICNKQCQRSANEHPVKFEANKTYLYQVKVTNEIVAKTNNNSSTVADNLITIDGQIVLQALNECDVLLQFENVTIRLLSQSEYANDEELDTYKRQLLIPILFSYNDGIVTDVCLSQHQQSQQEPFVVNVMKNIISSLQTIANIGHNTHLNVVETDYHGQCDTDYNVFQNGNQQFSVIKRKDLLKCKNIQQSDEYSDIGAMIEQSRDAHSECHQIIDAYHVTKTDCRSSRSLDTLLDRFDIDLVSQVQMRQLIVIDGPLRPLNHSLLKQEWIPDAIHLQKSELSSEWPMADKLELKAILTDICNNIKLNSNRMSMQTVDHLHQLRQAFKYESMQTIDSIWNQLKHTNSICNDEQSKKLHDIFIDTAASVLGINTVRIIRDELLALNKRKMHDPIARERLRYLTSLLAFARNPSAEAVQQLVPELLDHLHDSHNLLSVSALIKSVSSKQQTDKFIKFKEQIYKQIIQLIDENIKSERTEVQTVRLFIALENVCPLTMVKEQEQLLPIIFNTSLPDVIRVVAIKSLDAVQPTQLIRESLMIIFADRQLTNEIRVIAYRTLLRAGATANELQQILAIIKQEANGHIFNYVCSHQKMLRQTLSKVKSSSLPKGSPEFPEPSSILQVMLSRHYEYDSTDSNTAVNNIFETDVIMANSMFSLPRSITFNMTIAMGATEMAVAEVTIRQEGFDGSITEQIVSEIGNILSKHRINTATLVSMVQSMLSSNNRLLTSASNRRIQILVNLRGKNIFLYDSFDHENDLSDLPIQQIPINVDETMIVFPWQERILVQQTSTNIPIYLELNSTLIASIDLKAINHQNQSNPMDLVREWMLKPTFIARNQIGFGIQHKTRNGGHRFNVVSETITAPTIHLQLKFKDAKRLSLRLLLPPEQLQQVWLRSFTKIVRPIHTSSNSSAKTDKLVLTKCTPDIFSQMFGLSFCTRTIDSDVSDGREMIIDFYEIVLRKENIQMEQLAIHLEMPQQFFVPFLISNQSSDWNFSLAIATSTTDKLKEPNRFESNLMIQFPDQIRTDRLSVNMSAIFLQQKYHAYLELVDDGGNQHKSIILRITNTQNVQLMNVTIYVNVDDDNHFTRFNMEAILQLFKHMKGLNVNGMIANGINGDGKQQTIIKFNLNHNSMLERNLHRNSSTVVAQTIFKTFDFTIQLKNEFSFSNDWNNIHSINQLLYGNGQSFELTFDSHRSMINPNNQTELIDQEFRWKFGNSSNYHQFKVERKTRKQSNGNIEYTHIDLYYTPRNIHCLFNVTTTTKLTKRTKIRLYRLTMEDVNRHLQLIDANFQSNKTLNGPFKIEKNGQIKFVQDNVTTTYLERIDQIQQGRYRGKILIESKQQLDPSPLQTQQLNLPFKRLQLDYVLQNDIDSYQGLAHLLSHIRQLHYEASFENDRAGHSNQTGSLHWQQNNGNFHFKNVMRHASKLLFDFELDKQNHFDGKINLTIGEHNRNMAIVIDECKQLTMRLLKYIQKRLFSTWFYTD